MRTRGIWSAASAPRSPPTYLCRSANANDASNEDTRRAGLERAERYVYGI